MKDYETAVYETSVIELYDEIAGICSGHASGEVLCALGMALGAIFLQLPDPMRDKLLTEWTGQLLGAIKQGYPGGGG